MRCRALSGALPLFSATLAALSSVVALASAAPPPAARRLAESWSLRDGAPWPARWIVSAHEASATVVGGRGRLATSTTGPVGAPFVLARTVASVGPVDLRFDAESTGVPSSLVVRLHAGAPGELALRLESDGRYRVDKGGKPFMDAYSPTRRPPPAPPSTTAWKVRLRLEHHHAATDVYVKRWARGEPEPDYWDHAVWQDPDEALLGASGPLELEVRSRGASWLLSDLVAMPSKASTLPPRTGRHEPVDATVDLHVPADGRDVSLILAQALSRVEPGSTVYLEPHGKYGLEQTLALQGLHDLTIEGRGAVFGRSSRGAPGPYVSVSGCSRVVFSNLEISGKEPAFQYDRRVEFDPGFLVSGSEAVVIRDVHVHHVGGDAVQGHADTKNLTVQRLQADHVRRQGVSFNSGDGFVLEDSELSFIGRSVVDVEPYRESWSARNVVIRRNRATHFTNFFVAAGGAGPHDGMTIEDNVVRGGFGFAAIGNVRKAPDGTPVTIPATRVVIRRNTYDFRDPENVQSRNLSALSVIAADDVLMQDNSFEFFCEDTVSVVAPTAHVQRNGIFGVDHGLLVDTASRGCPVIEDNRIRSRDGARAQISLGEGCVVREPEGPGALCLDPDTSRATGWP